MPRRQKREKWNPPVSISIEIGGVTHRGSYQFDNGRHSQPGLRMIRVTHTAGEKVTHLGGSFSAPEGFAKLLLSEIVSNPQSREK